MSKTNTTRFLRPSMSDMKCPSTLDTWSDDHHKVMATLKVQAINNKVCIISKSIIDFMHHARL